MQEFPLSVLFFKKCLLISCFKLFLLHAVVGTLAPRPRDRNPSRWQKGPVMSRMSL